MPATSSTPRKAAIQTIAGRSALKAHHPNASENGAAPPRPTSDYFGINTFGWRQMRSKLPKDVYAKLVASIRHGKKLDGEIAPTVAQVIKEWAISRGVTHFTHWFQPLTGTTAEKHARQCLHSNLRHHHYRDLSFVDVTRRTSRRWWRRLFAGTILGKLV